MIPAVAAAISWLQRRATAAPDRTVALAFAIAAYVPMLLTAPGRVSADTKTYLTLDPGKVLAQAPSMWDPSVGAGTVPHQNIGYLFPLGPYYWLMDVASVPDWVAQRLLWGTLVFAAAFGAYRLMRWLGWGITAALVTGAAYGLSPYLLSYLARLSAILAPWAAMPWLLLFAARAVRSRSWRPAAWFAMTVALVGSINATSLVLAGLAVVVWLAVDLVGRRVSVVDATVGVIKIGVLCIGVSAWWIAGLRVQGAYGIPILRYTETYQAVASSSTPPEVLRGLGYWFFYGGDRLDAWVGPSAAYVDNAALMLLGFALAGLSLLGLLTNFSGRIRGVLLLLVGTVVSVGAAPLDASTWYGVAFEWFATESTAGAALRSTPRAAPLVILALAMGLGAGSDAVAVHLRERPIWRLRPAMAPALAVVLVCLQMYPWFTGRASTPSLERAEALPEHVTDTATFLDEGGDGRVYALPGSDFASYRWGGTVDPVIPCLVDRDVLYRELVPQGGAGTADLLNGFERRLAEGWFEPESLAPIAALLDVETVVLRNDLEHERYRLARPGPLWTDVTAALGEPRYAGTRVVDEPVIPLIDEVALARRTAREFPVNAAFDVGDSARATLRAAAPMIVAGSGDGLVDLAAVGLLEANHPVLYAASLDGTELSPDAWWVVTDTNRKQGRHWSTIGSNLGALEASGPLVIDEDPGDQQLDVFVDQTIGDQTIAVHRGAIADVRASYYGNKIAYTPEDAPWFALDGDPDTAWRAGVFDETTGLVWEADLRSPATTDTVTILQPTTGVVDRVITELRITIDDDASVDVMLDERSRVAPGQEIVVPAAGYSQLRLEVRADNLGRLSSYAGRPGIGLAEVSIPGVSDDRIVRVPINVDATADQRLTYLFTRQRIDPATSNRSAPEPTLQREFELQSDRTFELSGQVRLSAQADDTTLQSALAETPAVNADRRLPGDVGSRGASAVDGDQSTTWQTPFDDVVGATLTLQGPNDSDAGEDVLTISWLDDGRHSTPTEVTVSAGGRSQIIAIPAGTPVDGLATATVPVSRLRSDQTSITISGIDQRQTPEYFSGILQTMPLGIAEVAFGRSDGQLVTGGLDDSCRDDLVTLDGVPVAVRLSGETSTLLTGGAGTITSCAPLPLAAGRHRIDAVPGSINGIDVDRLILDAAPSGLVTLTVLPEPLTIIATDNTSADIDIGATDTITWLSWNQSWNAGWTASIDGADLGPPVLIDGYANGWQIPPSAHERTIELRWTPQRTVDIALLISAVFGLLILVLLVASPRSSQRRDATTPAFARVHPVVIVGGLAVVFLVVGGVLAALAAMGLAMTGRRISWLPAALIVGVWTLVSVGIVAIEFRRDYPAGPDWPSRFAWAAPLTWSVIAAVVVPVVSSVLVRTPGRELPRDSAL